MATLFVIFLTPETKGKTNEDMRNYFLKSKSTIVTEMGKIGAIPVQMNISNSIEK